MAETKKEQRKVVTPEFRCSYVNVFSARKSDNGKDVYSVTAIFDPKTDFTEMKKLAAEAKKAKWGDKDVPGYKSPFRKGVSGEYDLEKHPEYAGKIICTFRSYNRAVGVVGPDKKEITSHGDFYSGCYARASITAYAFELKGNRGIAFGLSNVMKTKDGERLGGSNTTADEDFADVPAVEHDNSVEFNEDDDI